VTLPLISCDLCSQKGNEDVTAVLTEFGKTSNALINLLLTQAERKDRDTFSQSLVQAYLDSKFTELDEKLNGPSNLLKNPYLRAMWQKYCGVLGAIDKETFWDALKKAAVGDLGLPEDRFDDTSVGKPFLTKLDSNKDGTVRTFVVGCGGITHRRNLVLLHGGWSDHNWRSQLSHGRPNKKPS
jgi:hypothetical protein